MTTEEKLRCIIKRANDPSEDEKLSEAEKKDKYARRRLYLRTLLFGTQGLPAGALIGAAYAGGKEGGLSGPQGAAVGALLGGTTGAGYGYVSGKLRQAFGMDPLLPTAAVTRSV